MLEIQLTSRRERWFGAGTLADSGGLERLRKVVWVELAAWVADAIDIVHPRAASIP